jgi:hypothetical protein
MKNYLLLALILTLGGFSCKKSKASTEYFSFDVNGEQTNYVQKQRKVNLGSGPYTINALKASAKAGIANVYCITGLDVDKFPGNEGNLTIWLPIDQLAENKEFVFDGVTAKAYLINYKNFAYDTPGLYGPQHNGKVTITKFTNERIEGTFDFYLKSAVGTTVSHITNGKFSIIPADE